MGFDIWVELEFVGSTKELPNSGENIRVHFKGCPVSSMVHLEVGPL